MATTGFTIQNWRVVYNTDRQNTHKTTINNRWKPTEGLCGTDPSRTHSEGLNHIGCVRLVTEAHTIHLLLTSLGVCKGTKPCDMYMHMRKAGSKETDIKVNIQAPKWVQMFK